MSETEEKRKTVEEELMRRLAKIEEDLRYIIVVSIATLFLMLLLLITRTL